VRKRIFRKKTVIIAACALALAFFLISSAERTGAIRSFAAAILTLPTRIFSEFVSYLPAKRTLLEQNEILRKRLTVLALETQQTKDLRDENGRLRKLLGLRKRYGVEGVSAEVLARNPNDWVGSLVIDKGTSAGLGRHSAVCSAKGLYGTVIDADEDTSTVMLVTHPGFKAGAEIAGTGISGVVVGSGKDTVRMIYIPSDADVKEGAMAVTSGMSRNFPRDIPIGQIIAVGKDRTGLYKFAVIRPAAYPFNDREVLCVK
jgi:rod shape-determining protein MreC